MTSDVQATRILVAEDDQELLASITRHLSGLPAEIVATSDGREALHLTQSKKPNLALLDVIMPSISGWEVCRAIRKDEALAATGIIIMTGIGQRLNAITSPLYGADMFINKPFEMDELHRKVQQVLAQHR